MADIIVRRIPATVSLVGGSVVRWLMIGIPIGLMSARHPGSLRNRLGQTFILIGLCFLTIVLGMVTLCLVCFLPRQAGHTWLPARGYAALSNGHADWAWHLVLPRITLASVMAAFYARLKSGQVLEVMGEVYIRTARSKGLTERRVVWKHGMRAALTPLVTQLGADIALLLSG